MDKFLAVRKENVDKLNKIGRASKTARLLFEYLEKNPIIEISQAVDALSMSFNAVSDMVKQFVADGILIKMSGEKRNRIYVYKNHFDVLYEYNEIFV